jgi:hypothetical protein
LKLPTCLKNVIPACRESFFQKDCGQAAMTGRGIAQYVFSPHLLILKMKKYAAY